MIKILKYGEVSRDEIFARTAPTVNVEATVAEIIKNVKELGDKALFEYCEKFDHVILSDLQVSEAEIEEAFNETDPETSLCAHIKIGTMKAVINNNDFFICK